MNFCIWISFLNKDDPFDYNFGEERFYVAATIWEARRYLNRLTAVYQTAEFYFWKKILRITKMCWQAECV